MLKQSVQKGGVVFFFGECVCACECVSVHVFVYVCTKIRLLSAHSHIVPVQLRYTPTQWVGDISQLL